MLKKKQAIWSGRASLMLMFTLILQFCLKYKFCKPGRRRIGCLRDSHNWKGEVTKEVGEVTKVVE